jgi:hypothetical protein
VTHFDAPFRPSGRSLGPTALVKRSAEPDTTVRLVIAALVAGLVTASAVVWRCLA